ncbi:MAG: hypothetical protein LQ342_002911 [Letrouitia transgressa]|nr:MAG: hypothetical protein LQ342_002911 [Letrouitia transgressa]
MSHHSYLIVGAGAFGASTAYHLIKEFPSAPITLIDRSSFPCPLAASYDWNKIVRADYGDPFYTQLATKAREKWKSDGLYSPFYHQSGLVNIGSDDLGTRMLDNYQSLGIETGAEIVGVGELVRRYPLLQDCDYSAVTKCYINPTSGWAEAAMALKEVVQTAVQDGVRYVEGSVAKLVFDEVGDCSGVQLQDGRLFKAARVILSTGASTPKLLADSAPERHEIQSEDRIVGAAVITATVKLTLEQAEKYKDIPVFIHRAGGIDGEILPPTPEGVLKFCRDVSFSNKRQHPELSKIISSPPTDQPNEGQKVPPQDLRDEIDRVKKDLFGKQADEMDFDQYRVCWDGITPNQDFLITAHPYCGNLYVATGGSFHGWKFLPIIGEYVVKLLKGVLEPELVRRWGWDKAKGGGAHEKLMPRRDLKNFK